MEKKSFSGQKKHFLEKNGFLTHWTARDSKVVLELFVWGLISYLSMKKKIPALSGKKCQTYFSIFTPTFFTYFLKMYLAMIACGIASEGPTTPHPISGERQRSEVSKLQECPESWSSDAK